MDGDDWQLASQLAYRRDHHRVGPTVETTPWTDVRVAEILHPGPGEGGYTRGAVRLGATPVGPEAPGTADYVTGSLTPDGILRQTRSLFQEAKRRECLWIICDAPPGAAEILIPELQQNGWWVALDSRMSSELGDAIAQRRSWCLASNHTPLPDEEWLLESGVVREFAPPLSQALDEPGLVPADLWWQPPWELQLDPRVGIVRLHTQPRILGRIGPPKRGRGRLSTA